MNHTKAGSVPDSEEHKGLKNMSSMICIIDFGDVWFQYETLTLFIEQSLFMQETSCTFV